MLLNLGGKKWRYVKIVKELAARKEFVPDRDVTSGDVLHVVLIHFVQNAKLH